MKLNEIFIKDGYTFCAIVADPWGGGVYHAIIYREKRQDFVFCFNYNTETGTWGQGHYVLTYEDALDCMVKCLNR